MAASDDLFVSLQIGLAIPTSIFTPLVKTGASRSAFSNSFSLSSAPTKGGLIPRKLSLRCPHLSTMRVSGRDPSSPFGSIVASCASFDARQLTSAVGADGSNKPVAAFQGIPFFEVDPLQPCERIWAGLQNTVVLLRSNRFIDACMLAFGT